MRVKSVQIVLLCAAALGTCNGAFAQNRNAAFGNFYGVSGPGVMNRPVFTLFDQGVGDYQLSSSTNTCSPAGCVSLQEDYINPSGHATTPLAVQFNPNGTDGAFSGSATYTATSQFASPQSFTIQFSGHSMVPVYTAAPKYYVLSILYDPPGNASSSGFSNTTSAGATTSACSDFSTTDSISFGGGFLGPSNSVTFSTTNSSSSCGSFETDYSATSGSSLVSVSQAINHHNDQVFLLIDPTITVTETGSTTGYFNFGGTYDATGKWTQMPVDILNVNIAGLLNPSLIPVEILKTQQVTPTQTLPGLKFICAKPLPDSQCTQQNACGCTANDFAAIVTQDELTGVTNQSVALSTIDPARYQYITFKLLQGPQQPGTGPVSTAYSVSDGTINGMSTSNGTSYSVSYAHGFSLQGLGGNLNITATNTFEYGQTQTVGTANGKSHSADVTLGTSDVGCSEYVDVYEDTTYHTFAYTLSQAPPSNCQ